MAARAGFTRNGVWGSALPLFHTTGCDLTVLGVATANGTLVLVQVFQPALVLEALQKWRVSFFAGVPAMLSALLNHPSFDSYDLSACSAVLSGGDRVPPELVEETERRFGALPGEICARGYQVMLGYHDFPEATAQTVDRDGWLHTGDLGVMDERRYVTVTGRLKDMIIRGGENLYPAEVEAALSTHPKVRQAAVLDLSDPAWGEQVAAVINATDPADPPTAAGHHDHLHTALAPYKTPRHWYLADAIPANAMGKIQKFVLRRQISDGNLKPLP
ncbi:class I adenylate-forming enzyme family protein [Streptomyces sp. NPDC002817]|uniref:class I adenylate-forming enzyme family protein n=1 Tax=Streptomyces sp. NPDC088357 TaxID=3154655 RepID=UPI0034446F91